jgi:hypothetical protein
MVHTQSGRTLNAHAIFTKVEDRIEIEEKPISITADARVSGSMDLVPRPTAAVM